MFPLAYIKIGLLALAILVAGYTGYSIEASRFEHYKALQVEQTQKAQELHQAATDEIRTQKDAQIASINNQLLNAVSQLRSRPNRTQASSDGQGGTGATLSAEDAEFLIREAARADILRTGLQACYNQYDSLSN